MIINNEKLKGIVIGTVITSIITTSLFSFGAGILKTISVAMDSVKVKVNGKELQSHNIIFDGRTYLQLRDISNALDKDIGWDGNTSTVSINDKQNNTSMLPSEDIKEINQQTQSKDPKQQFINYIEDFLYREHYDGNAWQIKSGAYKDK